MSFTFERPLIPKDEEQMEKQFKNSTNSPTSPRTDVSMMSLPDALQASKEYGSARHVYGSNTLRPPVEKALTDTRNFISMHENSPGRLPENRGTRSDYTIGSIDLNGSDEDDKNEDEAETITLDSDEDTSRTAPMTPNELPVNEAMKRRQEEWAERGAAKIVREVTNPETGQTTKHVIKKGIKDFRFGDVLGDGSYSTVMLARSNDSGKKYAVKVLNKEYLIRQKKVKYVNIEKNTLQRLNNSRGVIKLYFTFQDEASLYFLLEYAPNGDFLSVMKKFGSLSEECACYYSAQILDTIDFIHKMGVIHRDIKPENILLDKDMKIKLTDFGTAKLLDKSEKSGKYDLLERSKSFVGTAEYVSPELLNDNYVDYKCDIWAFGCILFQMISGKPPFKATNEYLTFQKVMKVQYAFTAGFPLIIRDLVKQILVKVPDLRPDESQIKKHIFFKDVNFEDGSVWDKNPPEIAPYKITAKAMQPVPGLKESKSRTVISLPKRQVKSASPSQSSSPSTTAASEMKQQELKKPPVDPRTTQILENAKKSINNRKQNAKRTTSAASAAAAALSKKTPISVSAPASSGNLSSSNGSSPTANPPPKPIHAPPPIKSHDNPPIIPTSSSSNVYANQVPPMGKVDILWSYYLKNIDERVIKMGEVNMCVTKMPLLEKKLNRVNSSLADPHQSNQRTTFLSQVARSGGSVTGFRTDLSAQGLSEQDYYFEWSISEDLILDTFKKAGSEQAESHLVSNKFKKLFQGKVEEPEKTHELLPANEFLKKIVVVTTFGRCLVFLKRTKVQPETNLFFDLQYDINVSQAGTRLKEVVNDSKQPHTNDPNDYFVIQTPFKSFVMKCDSHNSGSWLTALGKSIKMNHDRLLSKQEIHETANKAAKLASPKLMAEKSFTDSSQASSTASLRVQSSPKSSPKVSLTANSGTAQASGKPERLFDSFVSSKGKQTKRPAKPVPLSGKLINGLPSVSAMYSTGDDYFSSNDLGSRNGFSPRLQAGTGSGSSARKSLSGKSSRMLARSERTLRK